MTAASNPWGLTAFQEQAMDLYVKHGCHKGVARAKNCSVKNVDTLLGKARERMRLRNPELRNQFLCALAWHDWRKGSNA